MRCCGVDCTKEATLKCPTCLKQDLPHAHFCSQDCFKKNWSHHRLLHAACPYPDFNYSNTLRPFPITPIRRVPDHIIKPDYADTGIPTSEIEARKAQVIERMTPAELDIIRRVGKIARTVLDQGKAVAEAGVTTNYIDEIIHNSIIEHDAYPSPLNYWHFPKSCCVSVNEVICHGIPDLRPLQDGDLLNIDITVYKDGFHVDMNETILIGRKGHEDKTLSKLIECTKKCLKEAIAICKPNVMYREIGKTIEKIATSHNFSVVKSYGAHGVHKHFHCPPFISHYANNKDRGFMREGHVFTIEPMINEGTDKDIMWPDMWTVATEDGKRSAQFEHTIIITKDGCEVVTRHPVHDSVLDMKEEE